MIPASLLQEVNKIHGWLTNKEADLLFEQAQKCPRDAKIVEIGSYKGKSTICLANGSRAGNGARVVSIDPFMQAPYEVFTQNLKKAGVEDQVDSIVKTSNEAVRTWKDPIGLLFIDGNHEYSFVKDDFRNWEPYLIDGGVIALHYSTSCPSNKLMGYPGPKKVVDECIFKSKRFKKVNFTDTTTFALKKESENRQDRILKFYVRSKKQIPDSLLYLHNHLFLRMPSSFQERFRNIIP